MTFSGNFGINYPRDHVKVAKLPSLRSCNFVNFNMTLGQLIPNCPPSHTITITNENFAGINIIYARKNMQGFHIKSNVFSF